MIEWTKGEIKMLDMRVKECSFIAVVGQTFSLLSLRDNAVQGY